MDLEETATMREKVFRDLAFEARKFLIYRRAGYRDRQSLSIQRMRSLRTMLAELLRHAPV
jgi:cystathionine beta-lyase family protein involved in aluminum resistance